MDCPPVNALTVAQWFELADVVSRPPAPTRRRARRRAAGRGPRLQRRRRHQGDAEHRRASSALIGANKGCFAAFAAVYECAVPVIAAVHGFCVGGGIGLVGNADIIVASDDAYFGLPEVDRGALGAATHLSPARAPAQDAGDGVHVGHRDGGRAARVRQRARRSCRATSSASTAFEVGRVDRREVAHGHPGRQGEPQRHRPVGRQAQLPVRAGVHVRAQPAGVSDELRDDFAEGRTTADTDDTSGMQ